MNELLHILMALLAGVLLGAVFFGGLWWTVRKGLSARQPALWFGASMLLRSAIALGGFYLVAGTDWKRLLLCLLGFIVARLAVTRLIARRLALSPNSDGATSHSTRPASGQVAGYLPQAGERDAVSLREFHVNEADHAP
ncbi:MAG: ATP synthase subunit I [Gallionella sp.]